MTRVLRDLANMGAKGDVGKAKEYYDKGEYSLASVELKNAIKKDTTLAEAYFLHAKIFEFRKEYENIKWHCSNF